jgi:hypothetical protein
MHPSGLLAAFACETQVREYAITATGIYVLYVLYVSMYLCIYVSI